MMPTRIENYQALWKKRADIMVRGVRKSKLNAAKFVETQIRATVPRGDTGALYRSLKRTGSRVSIGAYNKWTGFPYVHWINRTKGTNMRTLHFKDPYGATLRPEQARNHEWTMIAKPGVKATYGLRPNWRWTGEAGFFSKAVDMARIRHVNMQRRVLETALSVKV